MNMLANRLCILVCALSGSAHAATLLYTNLVVNGGAESYTLVDPSASDGVADFPGWTRTGDVYVDTYANFGGTHFVNPSTEQFGNAYFLGGDGDSTQLRQIISVTDLGSLIDAG